MLLMKKIVVSLFLMGSIFTYSQKKWSLRECVDYAVANNLQIIQNQQNKSLQEKNLEIAKKQKLPGVSGSLGNTANFGQQQFGSIIQRNDSYSNSLNVGAQVLLYNNGNLEKNIRKSEFDVQASQYDIETITNNISLQIAQEYLSTLLNKEIVKINQAALDNAVKQYNRAKITTEVGTTPKTTQAQAEAAVALGKQNVKTAEVNVQRNLFNLSQLLMLPNYKEFDIQDIDSQSPVTGPLFSVDEILEKAYTTQPQIKAAESRIKSAEAQTEVIKTAFYPTITASAGLGTFYFNSLVTNTVGIDEMGNPVKESGFFKQYKNNFGQQIGINANIPIFNKGITKLQVEQSKINQELAKNNQEQQKLQVKQSVQKASFDAESNYQIYLAAIESEKSSRLALDFAEKSYEAGKTTIYDLNTARNNSANAQGSVAQAKYNYLFSLKLLEFYAGIPLSL